MRALGRPPNRRGPAGHPDSAWFVAATARHNLAPGSGPWLAVSDRSLLWWLLPVLPGACLVGKAVPLGTAVMLFVAGRAAAGLGLVLALGESSVTVPTRRLMGQMTLVLVQYGLFLALAQTLLMSGLVNFGGYWDDNWNLWQHAGLPFACLLVLGGAWWFRSARWLRRRARIGDLAAVVPLDRPQWSGEGPAGCESGSRGPMCRKLPAILLGAPGGEGAIPMMTGGCDDVAGGGVSVFFLQSPAAGVGSAVMTRFPVKAAGLRGG